MGPLQNELHARLQGAFAPLYLDVVNESSLHSVPPGSETHFKVVLVSQIFEGKPRVQRQRLVTNALSDLFQRGLHALSQKTLSPSEWQRVGGEVALTSPPCHRKHQ